MTTIKTARDLAKRVQRHPSTVYRWLRRNDWRFGRPPWPDSVVAKVLVWTELLECREGRPWTPAEIAEGQRVIERATGLPYAEWEAGLDRDLASLMNK